MDHISTVLTKVLGKRGLQGQADASLVVHQAQAWLLKEHPSVATDLLVKTCRDGTLSVEAKNSIAAQECQFFVDDLLTHLKAACSHTALRDIRLVRSFEK